MRVDATDATSVAACADGCVCSADTETALPWHTAAARARLLAWASLLWMTAEGAVGLYAGLGASSTALVGWALSSVIEGLASVVVIWRFTGGRTLSASSERSAQRVVAFSFWLLACYVGVDGLVSLVSHHGNASPTLLGVIITGGSLLVMPPLGVAKQRLGARLQSQATAGEGAQNLLCAYLAAAVLAGLAGTALWGWWWLDPLVALAVAAVAVVEGRQAWRGDDCC